MTHSNYHFITHWQIKGRIQTVYDVLTDGANYARWWKPAYVSSEEIKPNVIRSKVRAKLPYTLTFVTEPVRENAPYEIEIKSSGDLVGTGLWTLKREGEFVLLEFTWGVRAEKPWVRYLSSFLKPLFRWNHDWVMSTGGKALQAEVRRRETLSMRPQ